MLNFGLTDLRLVAPRDGWPNPDAGPSASGADVVLANARVFGSVAEAVADATHVYATTVRPRELTKPVLTPRDAAAQVRGQAGRSAVLFGAERSGLLTEELAIADTIITAPVNPEFGSLNLAQAVLLVAYEWWQAEASAPPFIANYDGPAEHASLEGLIAHFDAALENAGYYRVADRAAATRLTLRNLLTRPALSEKEVRTLRGVVSALTAARRPRG